LLVVGLMIGAFSSWAQANLPGWVPQEFKRGGGDELESSGRVDSGDWGGDIMGASTSGRSLTPETSLESPPRHELRSAWFVEPQDWLRWFFLFFWRW